MLTSVVMQNGIYASILKVVTQVLNGVIQPLMPATHPFNEVSMDYGYVTAKDLAWS